MSAVVLMTAVVAASAVARGETASEVFTQGESLLAKGQFPAALRAFATAARADRDNPEYMQHYAMTRRIVDLRSRLETEKNPQRWENMARAVRAFCLSERIYPELLKMDEDIHARLGTADTAAMLAETQLAMARNADAVKILSALEPGKTTAMTQVLLGIVNGIQPKGREPICGWKLSITTKPSDLWPVQIRDQELIRHISRGKSVISCQNPR